MPFFSSLSKSKARPVEVVCSTNSKEDGIELELETRQPIDNGARCAALDDAGEDYGECFHQSSQKIDNNSDSPTIVNNTEYPIVVFLERGVLFNKMVLYPNEAFSLTKQQTGLFPYKVHAVVGNEEALPTNTDSLKNLAKLSAVPAAFVAGCLATAATAGTLSGPSLALAPLVTGMVVKGVVIDTAALAAGAMAADVAKKVATNFLEHHKESLMGATGMLMPGGPRYFSVTGGLYEGPVKIERIPKHVYDRLEIAATKVPEKRSKKHRHSGSSSRRRHSEIRLVEAREAQKSEVGTVSESLTAATIL